MTATIAASTTVHAVVELQSDNRPPAVGARRAKERQLSDQDPDRRKEDERNGVVVREHRVRKHSAGVVRQKRVDNRKRERRSATTCRRIAAPPSRRRP